MPAYALYSGAQVDAPPVPVRIDRLPLAEGSRTQELAGAREDKVVVSGDYPKHPTELLGLNRAPRSVG
jgi:hypothetical protein